jgi:hypothetical protein
MGHGDAGTTLIHAGRRTADTRDAADRIVTPIVTPAAETSGG